MADLVSQLRVSSSGLSLAEIDLQRSAAADLIDLLSNSSLSVLKRAQEAEATNRMLEDHLQALHAARPHASAFYDRAVEICRDLASLHAQRAKAPHLFPPERARELALSQQAKDIAKRLRRIWPGTTEATRHIGVGQRTSG